MEKPIGLKIEETKAELIQTINQSKLAPVLLRPIVKDIYDEILALCAKEIEEERKQYEESLKETQEDDE